MACASASCCGETGAEANMPNQALLFQLGEGGQWLFKGLVFRAAKAAEPKIHRIQHIDAEIAKIVVRAIDDFPA